MNIKEFLNPTIVIPTVGVFEWDKFNDHSIFQNSLPRPPRNRADAEACIPGTCLKTKGSFETMMHGVVVKNTVDACIVIGHGCLPCKEEFFIWRGTRDEMLEVWLVD